MRIERSELLVTQTTIPTTTQREQALPYAIKAEGDVALPLTARLPSGVDTARVSFAVGDVLALPAELGGRCVFFCIVRVCSVDWLVMVWSLVVYTGIPRALKKPTSSTSTTTHTTAHNSHPSAPRATRSTPC